MAHSNITLATLRDDLRARIDEIAPQKFSQGELNRWLNVGQYEAFIRIIDMYENWYQNSKTLTINVADDDNDNIALSGSNYFDTDWPKVHQLKYVKATTYAGCGISSATSVPIVSFETLTDYEASTLHTVSHPKCAQVGDYLYFTTNLEEDDIFIVTYTRKPVNMTSALNFDLPHFCQDLVIMFAYQQCIRKLMKPSESIDRAISQRVNEIRQMVTSDVQLDRMQKEQLLR